MQSEETNAVVSTGNQTITNCAVAMRTNKKMQLQKHTLNQAYCYGINYYLLLHYLKKLEKLWQRTS